MTTLFCAALTMQAQRPQMMRMAEPGKTDQTARKFTLDLTEDGKTQMVCFLPTKPSGKAIVGIPGGGYSVLSNTHEGTMAADWLNQKGIAYFVVNYRLPEGNRMIPMSDVWQGFRIVRDSAAVWGINPRDVGIMGFSAGGHLASVISTHSEYDVRPDLTILFYPSSRWMRRCRMYGRAVISSARIRRIRRLCESSLPTMLFSVILLRQLVL